MIWKIFESNNDEHSTTIKAMFIVSIFNFCLFKHKIHTRFHSFIHHFERCQFGRMIIGSLFINIYVCSLYVDVFRIVFYTYIKLWKKFYIRILSFNSELRMFMIDNIWRCIDHVSTYIHTHIYIYLLIIIFSNEFVLEFTASVFSHVWFDRTMIHTIPNNVVLSAYLTLSVS